MHFPALPPPLRVASPGTGIALPQVPFVSSTTKAPCWEPLEYSPPAAQFPGVPHETEWIKESPPLRAATPVTFIAVPQRPFLSSTTKAREWCEPSVYWPTAAQLWAVAHETEVT